MSRRFAFLKDPYLRTALSAVLGTAAIGFGLAYRYASRAHRLLVIHFDRYRSIDFFGTPGDLLNIWAAGCFVAVLNVLLVVFWYQRDRVIARLLAFMTLVVQLLILLAIGVIIAVN